VNEYNPTRTDLLARLGLLKKIVRAQGHVLYDEDGTEYLDFLSQYGVMSLGHNHPELLAVLQEHLSEQRASMIQPFTAPGTQLLAEKLKEITPGDLSHTVFTNSGAEAAEAAIKLARARTGRRMILSAFGGFHGKTLGALSATANPTYQVPFGAPLPDFEYVPYGDLDSLEDKLRSDGDRIAAFIVEPVQGEGGIVPAPEGYLSGIVEITRRAGVLSIFDEVQTGLGRTGSLFGSDGSPAPDIMLLGKALGGGLVPIAACICTPETWDHSFGMLHSSTFAGNQLACTVALKVIDLLLRDDRKLIKGVTSKGEYLLARLEELARKYPDVIRDVRGRGLICGIEFRPYDGNDSYVMGFASMNGLLTALLSGYLLNVHQILTAATFNQSRVLRLEPPFTVTRPEIDRTVAAMDTMCDALHRREYARVVTYMTDLEKLPYPQDGFAPAVLAAPRVAGRATKPKRRCFAFLVHYTSEQDHLLTEPSLRGLPPDKFDRWVHWVGSVGPGVIHHVENFTLSDATGAEGWLLVVPMTPAQLLDTPRRQVLELMQRAVVMAANRGAGILGLGGLTSILTRGGARLSGNGIAIDSGSCLTALMAVDGIREVLTARGRGLGDLHVAIVGAGGAIGRLSALLLTDQAAALTLVGNPLSPDGHLRCKTVAADVYAHLLGCLERDEETCHDSPAAMLRAVYSAVKESPDVADTSDKLRLTDAMQRAFEADGFPAPVRYTCDLEEGLKDADVVLAAASSDRPLIHSGHLKRGAVVCDVARPLSVAPELAEQRSDAFIFEGGLVKLPAANAFAADLQGLPPDVALGCLAETALLAIEGDYRDHSIGRALSLDEANYIRRLAEKHSLRPALPEL